MSLDSRWDAKRQGLVYVEDQTRMAEEEQRRGLPAPSRATFCIENIDNAIVVFATLSSSGRSSIKPEDLGKKWDLLLVDEAAQASEVETLIPFRFNPKRLILVGDPQQLPAVIVSQQAEKGRFGRSMM